MTVDSIRTVGWEAADQVGAVLAAAFVEDPYARWLLPSAADFVLDSIGHASRAHPAAFNARTIYVLGEFTGIAIWEPPHRPDEASVASNATLAEPPPSFPPEFQALSERVAAYRPKDPHWYLAILAVDPAHRRKGVGTALLEHCLPIMDRDHLPTYLHSTNAANLSLYRRFGFELLDEVCVGASPPKYPMLRAAR